MSGININPIITTNALGTFFTESTGLIAGTLYDDPSSRNYIAGGVVSADEALPMWGGIGITEFIPPTVPGGTPGVIGQQLTQGPNLKRATSLVAPTAWLQATTGQLTGFTVFNQAHAMVNSPSSPAPVALQQMEINFVRFGSNSRLAVKMAPELIGMDGKMVTSLVSWDFFNQQLVPFVATYAANAITAGSWNSGTKRVTFTTTTSHGVAVGDVFTIFGTNPTAYDGVYTALSGTTGSTLVAALATDPGSYVSGGTLQAGGGAINVRVLETNVGNSQVVTYNPVTQVANWDRSGSAAIILI